MYYDKRLDVEPQATPAWEVDTGARSGSGYLGSAVLDPGVRPCQPEPFSLDSLIAWLRTKDKTAAYCYTQVGSCLWAQYTIDMGGAPSWSDISGWLTDEPQYRIGGSKIHAGHLSASWREDIACKFPQTFGAALERAISYQATRSGAATHE